MESVRRLGPDWFWVGGSDRRLARFENMFPLPDGVAYNAYLLIDEKTVLIDTVDAAVTRPFLENIEAALDGRPLDFLVVNHMEPDHCANIEALAARYPAMKIVGNRKTFSLMAQFYDFDVALREYEVKEGDRLPIGRRTLRFTFAPMVHWPEVMLTLEETEGVLFSADAFGAFGAFSGNLFSAPALYESRWLDEARRYYANIVGRYGGQVQRVLGKLAGADIRMICPAHGPIWRENLPYILEKYDRWSRYEPETAGVVLAYATMYGNTEAAVHRLAARLADRGVEDIRMFDVSKTHPSFIVAEVFRLSHLVLAAPTYNGGLYYAMDALLREMAALNVRKRGVAVVENGSWAPAAGKEMATLLAGMTEMELLAPPLTLKSAPKNGQREALDALADRVADGVLAARERL